MTLLTIEQLSVSFPQTDAVRDISFSINQGERFALVGESGSGKTVTALTILGLLQHAQIKGSIVFNGLSLLEQTENALCRLRGKEIAMIFQEPMSALNPVMTIGAQISEVMQLHESINPHAARQRTIELLARTGIDQPEQRLAHYPHQLSGGQRQRVMIAMALACKPKLLLADEPTTALDVTIRRQIMSLLKELQNEFGMAIMLITHDLNLVQQFAQRVGVMQNGQLVELGHTNSVFTNPQHRYTQKLLHSLPQRAVTALPDKAPPLLTAQSLSVQFPRRQPIQWQSPSSWFHSTPFIALRSIDLVLHQGETVGLIGESGSGKTTCAMALLGLQTLSGGQVTFLGQTLEHASQQTRQYLRSQLQIVFQDPFGSLSPRMNIEEIISEGLKLHQPQLTSASRRECIVETLQEVGLDQNILNRYPYEFSGGQRQRIAIARVLVLKPKIIVLDEPTSALDVSIQQQILLLLAKLQKKHGIAYLLISHDLSVIRALSHRILVLKDGALVEQGETEALIKQPQHPYTQTLFAAAMLP
jgi:microcin C transport system ATP-binding protein